MQAQQACQAEAAEGSDNQATMQLAKLGTAGHHPHNIERDFHRLCKRLKISNIDPYWIEVPMYRADGPGAYLAKIPVLLPRETAEEIMTAGGPKVFEQRTMGPGGSTQLF